MKKKVNFVEADNSVRSSSSNQQQDNPITGIIVDLKLVIDQINTDRNNAENLILELAKHLDEYKQCVRNQICRNIKNILGDKIKEGKITAKWIEECLPSEYKRKYTTKSELTSLSEEEDKPQQIIVDTSGKIIDEKDSLSPDNRKLGLKSKNNNLNQIDVAGYTVEQNRVDRGSQLPRTGRCLKEDHIIHIS
jgi:hypothetical protein